MINTPISTNIGRFTGTSISTVIGFDFANTVLFTPASLFAGGKQGVWYDPSDKSTLFQDVAGTVPVTKDGDPVALMKDKSGNGNHATQTVSTSRSIYKTDGILHWLEFDGVDDYLNLGSIRKSAWYTVISCKVTAGITLFGGRANTISRYYLSNTSFGVGSVFGTISPSLTSTVMSLEVNDTSNVYTIRSGGAVYLQSAYTGTTQPAAADFLGARNNVGTADNFSNASFYGVFAREPLNLSEVLLLEKYLAAKAGVTL